MLARNPILVGDDPVKALELFRHADLEGATAAARDDVRSRPNDVGARMLFVDLLLFHGDYDRADKQLDMLVTLDAELAVGVLIYKNLIEAQKLREAFFLRGEGEPELFAGDATEAASWMTAQVDAARCLARGDAEGAKNACDALRSELPTVRGTLNGEAFDSLCDCDDLLAPFLEVIAQDKLVLVPWNALQSITCEPPRLARDQLFAPATMQLAGGQSFDVHLPTLYPGAAADEDPNVRLGRLTDWTYPVPGLIRGRGQKQFDAGGKEVSCLELRRLEIASTT